VASHNSEAVGVSLAQDLAEQGVLLTDLGTAVRDHCTGRQAGEPGRIVDRPDRDRESLTVGGPEGIGYGHGHRGRVRDVTFGGHYDLMVACHYCLLERDGAGGGAVETELLMKIRDYASTVGGRVQLALEAYAAAYESIPRALAENSGFNPIDKLVELKAAHARRNTSMGLNVYTGKIVDMYKAGVYEPMRVKVQAIQSATEAANMLIRVDDMMITQNPKMPPGGMPGGMPPMG
jgi:hypothetical protein